MDNGMAGDRWMYLRNAFNFTVDCIGQRKREKMKLAKRMFRSLAWGNCMNCNSFQLKQGRKWEHPSVKEGLSFPPDLCLLLSLPIEISVKTWPLLRNLSWPPYPSHTPNCTLFLYRCCFLLNSCHNYVINWFIYLFTSCPPNS